MHKRSAGLVVALLAIPVLGGFATYAAAQVNTRPAPQVVIPGGPGHDAKDDRAKTTISVPHTPTTVTDDKAGHDANDDKGKDNATPATVSDDPAGHDANDDKGGAVTPTATQAKTPTSTPTSVDDHGGNRGSGSKSHDNGIDG